MLSDTTGTEIFSFLDPHLTVRKASITPCLVSEEVVLKLETDYFMVKAGVDDVSGVYCMVFWKLEAPADKTIQRLLCSESFHILEDIVRREEVEDEWNATKKPVGREWVFRDLQAILCMCYSWTSDLHLSN